MRQERFQQRFGGLGQPSGRESLIEVERDLTAENGGYGNEVRFGGGKVIRDGMDNRPQRVTRSRSPPQRATGKRV